MTVSLSIPDLWRETFAAGRAGMPLYLPIALAFVLLPNVASEALGPPLPRTPNELTSSVVFVHLLLPSLIGLVAQAAIVRLAIDSAQGAGRSVGDALGLALRAWPGVILAVLLAGLPTVGGFLLLIVPGLYIAGRLALTLPLVVADGAAPVDAVRRSWDMTEDNGWRIIGFVLSWAVLFVALSILASAVGAALASVLTAAGLPAAGTLVVSAVSGLVASVFTVFNAVGLATVFMRLRALA